MKQIRQNTAQIRGRSAQDYSDSAGALVEPLYSNPEVLEFFIRAQQTPDSLSESDWIRWHLMMTRIMRHFEAAHYQFRAGTMDEDIWSGIRDSMVSWMDHPGMLRWLQRHGQRVTPALYSLLLSELPKLGGDAL